MSRQSKAKRLFAAFVLAVVAYALILGSVATPAAFAPRANASPIRATNVLPNRAGNVNSTTILVYLNGSDLESEAGLATADISEMLESGIGTNANVVIETLGTRQWQNYGIASDHSQRYRVNKGSLELVDDSLGSLPWILFELVDLFQWVAMLNLGIGLFNLLPIKPLDGGYMLETLLSYKLSEQYYKPIVNALSAVLAMVIVFSIVAGLI